MSWPWNTTPATATFWPRRRCRRTQPLPGVGIQGTGRCAAGGPGNGESIAGGAFRRYNNDTAEFKRIWTHSAHRRRGLARFVLAELEALAARRGYRRVFLTTGPRQPEAKHLYLASGYEPQFDLDQDPEIITSLAFTKNLPAAPLS